MTMGGNNRIWELGRRGFVAAAFFAFMAKAPASGQTLKPADLPADITQLSLEDLLNVEVTSAAKVPQKLLQTPAAISVLRQEDIRRSGATSIPELLRQIPGVEVARIDSNRWAITARAPNNRFANKLLVLIDGRSVYTPLHGGVYWDAQDTLLEDVDRIEVIRGPNAALWGANASTGVINIITKSSKETHGGLLSLGGGAEEKFLGALRWGGLLADDGKSHYRTWVKANERDDTFRSTGVDGQDGWSVVRGGFRMDWDQSESDSFTFQGDIFDGREDQPQVIGGRFRLNGQPFTGANLLARWKHVYSAGEDLMVQMWFDRTDRSDPGFVGERRDTYDLESLYRKQLDDEHELLTGVEVRHTSDQIRPLAFITPALVATIGADPRYRDDPTYSFFAQDRIKLDGEKLMLILGGRVENNNYSGTQFQPTVRMSWSPDPEQTYWAAVSRATRTPSRFESDLVITIGPARFTANKDLDSEDITAYEAGWRGQPSEDLQLSASIFYQEFDDIVGIPPGVGAAGGGVFLRNISEGTTKGAEVGADWSVTEDWRLGAGYTFLETAGFVGAASGTSGTVPEQQLSLRSYYDLSKRFELDGFLYVVDNLDATRVPGYTRLDLRLGYKAGKDLDLSLVGQNLLDDRHPEFGAATGALGRLEIERSIYGKATWKF